MKRPARRMGRRGPPRSPEERIAAPRRLGGGRITLRLTAASRVMSARPRAPRCSRAPPTCRTRRRLHSLAARHPTATSPAPQRGSGCPPPCMRLVRREEPAAVVVGCARRGRRRHWARCRDSVRPPMGISRLRCARCWVGLWLSPRGGHCEEGRLGVGFVIEPCMMSFPPKK